MSQNTLTTTSSFGDVRLSAGWDRPLRELFCRVEFLADVEPDPFPDYLLETNHPGVDQMVDTLARADIHLPTAMIASIGDDVTQQAGNIIRQFLSDGTIVREVDLREQDRSARPR
jgi:hypothetical protein